MFVLPVLFISQVISVPSADAILRRPRDLTPSEIATVVAAARATWSGHTFRVLSLGEVKGPELEMLMADDGRPQYVLQKSGELVTIEHYTRHSARSCDGKALSGELVIVYARDMDDPSAGWQSEAHSSASLFSFFPYYEIFGERLESGPIATIDGHLARALTGPGVQTSAMQPVTPDYGQRLWIDVDTLLIVRWELTYKNESHDDGYSFLDDPKMRIRPPSGVPAPDCVASPQTPVVSTRSGRVLAVR